MMFRNAICRLLIGAALLPLSSGCTAVTTRPDDLVRRVFHVVPPSLPVASDAFRRQLDRRTRSRARAGNQLRLLRDGAETYPAMLAAIGRARRTVDFCIYNYAPDATGRRFLEALTAAAARGVRVRVCYDRFGSPNTHPDFFAPLTAAGAEIRLFNPYNSWTLSRVNNRNHEKILVVDGETAFLGSVNLADKHNGDGRNSWHDLAAEVQGPVVTDTIRVFQQAWNEAGHGWLGRTLPVIGANWLKKILDWPLSPLMEELPPAAPDAEGTAGGDTVRVVVHTPESLRCHLLDMMELAIAGARRRVCICSPYFIPPPRLRRAMLCARERGVEVILLTQGESDVDFMPLASQNYLKMMEDHGIRVYAWPHSVLHAKYVTVDGAWATLGSCNFDSRSLILNYEANWAFTGRAAAELEALFLRDIADATPYNRYRDMSRDVPLLLRLFRHQF